VNDYVKRRLERKIREPSGYFIYPGNGEYLFCTLSDNLSPDTLGKTSGMEGRRRKLVHCAGGSDKILLAKLKPITQLELFSA